MNREYIEIPEDYWVVDKTFNEDFKYVFDEEKELSDIYI